MSNRRDELNKEIEIAQKRIDDAESSTPSNVMDTWVEELDSLSFELNNLYDDGEND